MSWCDLQVTWPCEKLMRSCWGRTLSEREREDNAIMGGNQFYWWFLIFGQSHSMKCSWSKDSNPWNVEMWKNNVPSELISTHCEQKKRLLVHRCRWIIHTVQIGRSIVYFDECTRLGVSLVMQFCLIGRNLPKLT